MRFIFTGTIRCEALIIKSFRSEDFTSVYKSCKEFCKDYFAKNNKPIHYEIESLCSVEDKIRLELLGGISNTGKLWDDYDYMY